MSETSVPSSSKNVDPNLSQCPLNRGRIRLDLEQLAHLALRSVDDHYIEVQEGQEATGIVDKMLATLDLAAKLMIGKTEYKWDVENLKRIFLIIGGLDEKVVQEILDEEKV